MKQQALSIRQPNTTITHHAAARIRQRGYRQTDLDIIRAVGEPVSDGFLMSNKAVDGTLADLRRQIEALERLRGSALIEASGKVITVYRADARRIKRLRADTVISH